MVIIDKKENRQGTYLQTIICSDNGDIEERITLANGKVTIIQYRNGKEINRRN